MSKLSSRPDTSAESMRKLPVIESGSAVVATVESAREKISRRPPS
jgi:hypothetical protein